LTIYLELLFFAWEQTMEELEFLSWLVLDAIQKEAEIEETVGDLQSGHWKSVFCTVEDDFLELVYSDTSSNYIRRFEDKEEFGIAIEKRKEETGEPLYEEERSLDDSFAIEEPEEQEEEDYEEEPEL
jgi:hypothetical protein